LAGKTIRPCLGCYRCQPADGDERYFCQQHKDRDDMHQIYPELVAADALIIASPVYFGTVSAQTKLFMDRMMPFHHAFKFGGIFDGRPGGALSQGLRYHGGQELTINTIHTFFLHLGMVVVGTSGPKYCHYGGAGVELSDEKASILQDEEAVDSARNVASRIAKMLTADNGQDRPERDLASTRLATEA
jgi:multimeric flavodoxin WrbA